jgi:hypothetical protein
MEALAPHWVARRRNAVAEALFPDLMLFGEWCYALHSVHYTKLPDWFLAVDVYDRAAGAFWSVERRNELDRRLSLAIVPELARGRFDLERLLRLLGDSRLTDGPDEGIYVRREAKGHLALRAKPVRADFVQAINEHWSKRGLSANQLADGSEWY